MSPLPSEQTANLDNPDQVFSNGLLRNAKSNLTKVAAWITERDIPFLVCSVGLIVMLLWAGSFKMTGPGAEAITPLVSNSPFIGWHFKVFGPIIGSDIIGLTEIIAALLIITGYFGKKAILSENKSMNRMH
jgi:reactive chlorine resistance protein C